MMDSIQKIVELLRDKLPEQDNSLTSREIADALGLGTDTALKRIRKALLEGAIECVQVKRPYITGVIGRVWAYRIKQVEGQENDTLI